MIDKYRIEFHLTRGPTQLPRQFSLTLPDCNSQTQLFTVGRAVRCNVILDPLLVFASNVQCSICCVAKKQHTSHSHEVNLINTSDTNTEMNDNNNNSMCDLNNQDIVEQKENNNNDANMNIPTESENETIITKSAASTIINITKAQVEFPFQVYITDMCSSNGTFVNNTRISTTEPTLLHDEDRVIFGGLRDVEIGDELPKDAFDVCEELTVWKVKLRDCINESETETSNTCSNKNNIASTCSTPHVEQWESNNHYSNTDNNVTETRCTILPSAERLDEEQRILLEKVQETLLLKQSSSSSSSSSPLSSSRTSALASTATTLNTNLVQANNHSGFRNDALLNSKNDISNNIHTQEEYSPLVKQQLFVNETPNRIEQENNISCMRLSDCKSNICSTYGALNETIANTVNALSTPFSTQSETRKRSNANRSKNMKSLLLDWSSPHNLELPPEPLTYSAVRVGKVTFHVKCSNENTSSQSERCSDEQYKQEDKNMPQKRAREDEEKIEMPSLTEVQAQLESAESTIFNKKAKSEQYTNDEVCTRHSSNDDNEENRNNGDINNNNNNSNINNDVSNSSNSKNTKNEIYSLSFTSTHWKWKMKNIPGRESEIVSVLLPITSIATLLVCCDGDDKSDCFENCTDEYTSCHQCTEVSSKYAGIAIELKDHCQIPLLPKEITEGGKENRWIVWKLKSTMETSMEYEQHQQQQQQEEYLSVPSECDNVNNVLSHSNDEHNVEELRTIRHSCEADSNNNINVTECITQVNTTNEESNTIDSGNNITRKITYSLRAPWIASIEKFYRVYNLPRPLFVTSDTIEKILDPTLFVQTNNIE